MRTGPIERVALEHDQWHSWIAEYRTCGCVLDYARGGMMPRTICDEHTVWRPKPRTGRRGWWRFFFA